MDELELLKSLGAKVRSAEEPAIDVTARVIEKIGRQQRRRTDTRLSILPLSVCACVLIVIAFLATGPFRSPSDTLEAFAEATINSTGPEAVLKVFQP